MRSDIEWTEAVVRKVNRLTPTIREFELAPVDGVRPWTPGSHIDVTTIVGGQSTTRSYSLVGRPDPGVYRIAVKELPDSRGGSRYMHTLVEGARLVISAPKNFFELGFDAPEYLLIAGGIGITPLTGMALALAQRGAALRMVYGARSDDELAFRDQLAGALGSRLAVAVDARGERIDVAGEIARLAPQGEAYVCGPVPLLNLVRKCWAEAGRDPTRLRYETFGNSGRYAPEPFWVRVPDQGAEGRAVELAVAPDQTLLDALIDAGVDVMYDCRRGECGLCAVNVLQVDGEIDHRDVFFSDEERAAGRKLCACVSRVVHGGIVVDAGYRDDGRRFA